MSCARCSAALRPAVVSMITLRSWTPAVVARYEFTAQGMFRETREHSRVVGEMREDVAA